MHFYQQFSHWLQQDSEGQRSRLFLILFSFSHFCKKVMMKRIWKPYYENSCLVFFCYISCTAKWWIHEFLYCWCFISTISFIFCTNLSFVGSVGIIFIPVLNIFCEKYLFLTLWNSKQIHKYNHVNIYCMQGNIRPRFNPPPPRGAVRGQIYFQNNFIFITLRKKIKSIFWLWI